MIKSQEQEYMQIAHAFVKDAKSLSEKEQNEYQSRVQSAPVLIHDTGLMQTLAFYISKDERSLSKLAKHLLSWLNYNQSWQSHLNEQNWQLFSNLIDQSSEQLLLNTQKMLKLLQWLKRFSESQLKKN